MEFTLLTPSRKLVERIEVTEVMVPGVEGQLDLLTNHANFVSGLETGIVRWKSVASSPWNRAAVSTGFVEVEGGNVTVLADVSELASEISVERAQKAEIVARQKIQEGGLDDLNFRKYELKLKRAMARQSAKAE